jgi:hypothetical protein
MKRCELMDAWADWLEGNEPATDPRPTGASLSRLASEIRPRAERRAGEFAVLPSARRPYFR